MTNRRVIYPADPSSEFYTPRAMRELAARCLGAPITFDPTTSKRNPMGALHFRTRKDNRSRVLFPAEWEEHRLAVQLASVQYASLWWNPPYGREAAEWVELMRGVADRHPMWRQLALLPARSGSGWYEQATLHCQLRCELRGRLTFEDARGRPIVDSNGKKSGARWGSTLFYWGPGRAQIARILRSHGVVTLHRRSPYETRLEPRSPDPRQLTWLDS